MFRAQPMTRATLWLLASEAPDAALLLARHGTFAPVDEKREEMPESPAERYREIFLEADSRLNKILEHCGGTMPPLPDDIVAPNLAELEELNAWLKTLWQTCSATSESEARIEEERKHLTALRETFARLKSLDLDISRLFRHDSLLDARLGQLPSGNVQRLKEALALAGYLLSVFDVHEGLAFAVVAGPRGGAEGMGGVLIQAGWRDLPVPTELQSHPEKVRKFLETETVRLEQSHAAHCQVISDNLARFGERIQHARLSMTLARPLAEASLNGVRGKGQLSVFTGWVPKDKLDDLQQGLDARFHGRYMLETRQPKAVEHNHVPSLLRYPAWLGPFVPLVKSYGIPRYGEFDPALIFAVTYLLLFGAMFGDVGHGGVILMLSVLLYRKLGRGAWLGISAGVVSMGFGLLYGSIFGYEDVLEPVWLSPLHDPIRILTVAILFGVGFIVFTLLANIYNKLNAGHVAEALFDSTGLAGLVFYLGATGSIMGLAGQADFGQLAWGTALLGIVTVAVFKWVETRATLGERALVTAIETLETGINLFANTLSFMRVAAFSLNHVALALAVFTIANGLGTAGHWLTIFLGNVIIIVLEGGIVAIQALRLMYYEGFSRFFSGDGTEFTPLRLAGTKEASIRV
ncbi:MAG: ATPase [Hydrogenophilales bacterium]|nr:ATPase [Hydrogenophilales bacterium]